MRRLSRVADSSSNHYSRGGGTSDSSPGIPVYVGEEEKEKFVVSADLLNRPLFAELLKRSAHEYGFEQKGVLRIPCRVCVFQRVLEALQYDGDLEDVLRQFDAHDVVTL
ncbi:hypothetical protein GIB67_022270 [Kingdonia uniflora]|uniref:Uncharacterized protein n=1 Tax=Kingdonia uniflora TaxID=39325 RepID=A0A7J7M7D4_9MAGN|nr:hypothetical protein GIB67_022270 [Kingdonia uniflora]